MFWDDLCTQFNLAGKDMELALGRRYFNVLVLLRNEDEVDAAHSLIQGLIASELITGDYHRPVSELRGPSWSIKFMTETQIPCTCCGATFNKLLYPTEWTLSEHPNVTSLVSSSVK